MLKVDTLVFVTNSSDFGPVAAWGGYLGLSTHHPLFASWHLFRWRVWSAPAEVTVDPPPSETKMREWRARLYKILTACNGRVILILYPNRTEETGRLDNLAVLRKAFAAERRDNLVIYAVADDCRWNKKMYWDAIHASVEGIKLLAAIMADRVRSNAAVAK